MAKELGITRDPVRVDEDSGGTVEFAHIQEDDQLMYTESHRHSSALKIQKSFRGMRGAILARSEVRNTFTATFGEPLDMINVREIFRNKSSYLRQLIFFFTSTVKDEKILCQTCELIADSPEGEILSYIDGTNCYLVRRFVLICVQTAHKKRFDWCAQIMLSSVSKSMPFVQLLESAACILNCESPLVCQIIGHLQEQKVYLLFRDIFIAALEKRTHWNPTAESVLEKLLITVALHNGDQHCCCPLVDPQQSFICNILSISGIWDYFPLLKKVFSSKGMSYIHQLACNVPHSTAFLPHMSATLPGYACVLANLLEADGSLGNLANVDDMVVLYSSLLDDIPIRYGEDGGLIDVDDSSLQTSLYRQIAAAFSDSPLLEHFVNHLATDILAFDLSDSTGKIDAVVEATMNMSIFLYLLLDTFGDQFTFILANQTDFILLAMKFFNLCKSNNLSMYSCQLEDTIPSGIITLHIFALIFRYLLETMGQNEFYEHQKPLSFDDLQLVVFTLKEALWELLCHTPTETDTVILGFKKLSHEKLKSKAKQSICELLVELQDWNSRREFTSDSNFCCVHVNEEFVSKALQPGTLECQIIEFAPLLIPFHIRVSIFESHLITAKTSMTTEVEIRRLHVFDDSLKLSRLTDNELKGLLRVIFVDEHGYREDGIDLGGPYRQFLDDTSKVAFGSNNKLMKETVNHQLYPDPSSGSNNRDHLKLFRFLGTLLGKAVFDRLPLDIPLAPFFIRKLKEKSVFLNDLMSLDVELYERLQDIKKAEDLSLLDLFFTIGKLENGIVVSEDLTHNGEDISVTEQNVNSYIHLYATHLLNTQIEPQSVHFLKGFHRLIKKEWIDMFNEQEFQIIISGSDLENGLDMDDMSNNTQYIGYTAYDLPIIMFWEILRGLDPVDQIKFFKFVTGLSRVPFGGFSKLQPKFSIARDGENVERFPTSSTCVNELHLPAYESETMLRSKLLEAINSGSSFGLA